jgi:hypothetical protein
MSWPIAIPTSPNFAVLFFAQFPRIHFDIERPIMHQFHELREKYRWTDLQAYSEKHNLCTALARQFNAAFGTKKTSFDA